MNTDLVALWHFTPLSNLDSILRESRLLSYAASLRMGVQPYCVSDKASRDQDLANGRANYVFLSLAHYSPFFQKSAAGFPHVWFRISTAILRLPDVKTKGGASQSKHIQLSAPTPRHLQQCMRLVHAEKRIRYRDDGGPDHGRFRFNAKLDPVTSSALSTEILVPESIDLCKYAEGIYVISPDGVKAVFHPLTSSR